MKTVILRGKKAAGRVAVVDDGDLDLVSQYPWYVWEVCRAGRPAGPYAIAPFYRNGKRTTIRMHTLITGWPLVDHEDHDGLNNQRHNLRPATPVQNAGNMRGHVGSFSRFKGVSWSYDGNVWVAQIRINGHSMRLGRFAFEEEAARAYDVAAFGAWGEYAHLNFPDEHRAVPGCLPSAPYPGGRAPRLPLSTT